MKAGTVNEAKLRWAELDDDDGEDLDFLLPPKEVIGPDENGIKKVIEYKFNEQGNKVKITRTVQTRKLAKARLSKKAVERRSWAKFGEAVNGNVGDSRTVVSTEEIKLERPKGIKPVAPNPLAPKGVTTIKCRVCQGDHWSSSCPHKDLLQHMEASEVPISDTQTPGTSKKTYVPPGLRPGADKTEMRPRRDENSVRVTNLSEDTREPDLLELFRPFGDVSRVYVALDKETQVSRGFGFVNFVRREDAQRAINKLNGYGYDNLILSVEWATPRPN